MHGVPLWDKVQANIKRMVELKAQHRSATTIGLQMVLTPHCVDQVVPEAHFALDNKLDYFVIKQFSDPGCEAMSRFPLDWYDKCVPVLQWAEGLSNDRTRIVPKYGMIQSKGKRPYDRCVDCALIFQISGNSKCYPCGYLFNNPAYCYGDLRTQTLKEILDSDQYWKVVKYMRNDFDVHKDCSGCCRHDFTNEFIWKYLNPPDHINFI